jgi:hypothetical protein
VQELLQSASRSRQPSRIEIKIPMQLPFSLGIASERNVLQRARSVPTPGVAWTACRITPPTLGLGSLRDNIGGILGRLPAK